MRTDVFRACVTHCGTVCVDLLPWGGFWKITGDKAWNIASFCKLRLQATTCRARWHEKLGVGAMSHSNPEQHAPANAHMDTATSVCLSVRLCVRLSVCLPGWLAGWLSVCMYAQYVAMYECLDGWMDGWIWVTWVSHRLSLMDNVHISIYREIQNFRIKAMVYTLEPLEPFRITECEGDAYRIMLPGGCLVV